MALIRDFELPSTGLTAPNAYHVVKKVTTEKRLVDIPPPPDPSRPDGVTERPANDKEVYWKAGYVGRIRIEVFVVEKQEMLVKNQLVLLPSTQLMLSLMEFYHQILEILIYISLLMDQVMKVLLIKPILI